MKDICCRSCPSGWKCYTFV